MHRIKTTENKRNKICYSSDWICQYENVCEKTLYGIGNLLSSKNCIHTNSGALSYVSMCTCMYMCAYMYQSKQAWTIPYVYEVFHFMHICVRHLFWSLPGVISMDTYTYHIGRPIVIIKQSMQNAQGYVYHYLCL